MPFATALQARFHPLKTCVLLMSLAALTAAGYPQSSASSSSTPAPPPNYAALPDILGIKPGMPAQQAYELLKAHSPKSKIVIGQYPMPGVSEKPVPTAMAVSVLDADPAEYVVLLLTPPPAKQVVWSVSRTFEMDRNKPLLTSKVLAGLRQKYGPEVGERFWAFDEQGQRNESVGPKGLNCPGRVIGLNVAGPNSMVTEVVSSLLSVPLASTNPCYSFVAVSAVFNGPNPEYVFHVDVELTDWALGQRAQQAYQAFVANANAAKQKNELEKAKKRDGPVF